MARQISKGAREEFVASRYGTKGARENTQVAQVPVTKYTFIAPSSILPESSIARPESVQPLNNEMTLAPSSRIEYLKDQYQKQSGRQ